MSPPTKVTFSVSCDSEHVDDDPVVALIVFFVVVSIMFLFPEAARAHVEAHLTLLKYDDRAEVLVVLTALLLHCLNDFLRHVVSPLLALL